MKKFEISAALSKAWEIFKENGLTLTGIALAVSLIPQIIGGIINAGTSLLLLATGVTMNQTRNIDFDEYSSEPAEAFLQGLQQGAGSGFAQSIANIPGNLVSSILSAILTFGFVIFVIRVVKGNTSFSLDAWKQNIVSYLKYFVVTIAVSFAVMLGLLLCILPGIYLALRLEFASIAMANDPSLSISDAIKKSWDITEGHLFDVFLIWVLSFAIACIGLMLCCIGVIPAAALLMVFSVVCFLQLSKEFEERTTL